MKNAYSIILILILSFISLPLAAQSNIYIGVDLDLELGDRNHHQTDHRDVHGLRTFQLKIDRFLWFAEQGNWRKANRIKRSLLKDMKKEIRYSRQIVNSSSVNHNRGKAHGLYKKNGRSVFNKRKSQNHSAYGDYSYYEHVLNTQKRLYQQLKHLRLRGDRNRWVIVEQHARILYDFEYTLTDQVYPQEKKKRRKRTRRLN